MSKHPDQPVELDSNGVPRFKANAIVRFLLDSSTHEMNKLLDMSFGVEDWNQLAQLVGCSAYGFGVLPYADPESVAKANVAAATLLEAKW